MYCRYFGLQEPPFSIAPNPRYLFMSERHREALAHLLYGVGVGGGFVLLTGEVGTGKTTVSRCLLEQLPDNTDVAFILNPYLDAAELLATLCEELGIDTDGSSSLKELNERLYQFLLENHAKGRNTVLLIDEAQHLQYEVLETIRLLTNLETNTKKLLQIIFVGQPELQALLAKPSLRQLAQRITARFHIDPLNLAETEAYIAHRLRVAGLPANQQPFSLGIIKSIYSISGGIPRIINVLCDRMLLGTYSQGKTVVDRGTLKQAALEVMGKDPDKVEIKPLLLPVAAACVLIVGIAGLAWWQWPLTATPAAPPVAASAPAEPIAGSGFEPGPEPRSNARPEPQMASPSAPPPASTAANATPSSPATPAPVAVTLPPSPAVATIDTDPATYLYTSEEEALNQLLLALGVAQYPAQAPCADIVARGWRCERQTVKSWREFREINRPAVLALRSRDTEETQYAALVGIERSRANISFDGESALLPLTSLGESWDGEFLFIWRPPEDFRRPISLGDSSSTVEWLAITFARMDGGVGVWSGEEFDSHLSERVKQFQRRNNIDADGIVGIKTLLKLNDQLGIDKTLDKRALAHNGSNEKG
ncbi:AAA family ATPase [Exilibacterium tricleocarpae]|uniref:AAA family ATPase n=1 Tax=Exilibacterium tricleocarpae TaxID=2591008 RepID=A0A545SLZ6_9GAMM|nr:AAA family ATPase [Exilibacterium tricleocarpae]TQV65992.1 AAA family ATPase [Exilibacterium tricleocarpae]